MHRPVRSAALVVALAAPLALTACGGDESASTSSRAPAPTAPAATTTLAPTDRTAAPTTTTVVGDPGAARVALEPWAEGLDSPVALAVDPTTGRVVVAEQYRGVRAVAPDGTVGALVLDLADAVSSGNEQGVLGLAFAPDGAHLYVNTTGVDGHTAVTEYAVDAGTVDPASARVVLEVEQPFANHNGGDLKFGPDGLLYVSLGDGGAGGDPLGSGQDRDSLLGKILRIDPRPSGGSGYSVPADNPFVAGGGAGEVFHLGLRNPWRISFDRATGDLWIGDVGQNEYEEISLAPAGSAGLNFGWNEREGFHDYDGGSRPEGAVDPVIELAHGDGYCSITGGFVYRGTTIPELAGAYVFGDYCAGRILAIDRRDVANPTVVDLGVEVAELTSFGEDRDGELYAVGRNGTILRLAAAS